MARCKAVIADGAMCAAELPRGKKFCKMHSLSTFQLKPTTFAIKSREYDPEFRYADYLQSEQWKERARRERRFNPNCSMCNRKGELHVHHRTYVRVGNEAQGDLIVLCDDCHTIFHRFYEYNSVMGCFVPSRRK